MKKYTLEVSQNGWEYTGFVYITAKDVTKINGKTILVDGVVIEFDEEIGLIREVVLDNDTI